jgi:ABC-type transport system involved in cytochrome c biogenesis permease subunit
MKHSPLIPSLFALSLAGPLADPATAAADLQPLRQIAIQEGGRAKPLDTFARELAKRVQGAKPFGFERVAGLEPIEWLLASLASPERWQAEPIVRVTHAGLRRAAGLPGGRDRFSFQELAGHEGLQKAVAGVRTKLDREQELDPVDREVFDLYDTLMTYQGVMSGEALHVVPHPDDPQAAWYSIADLGSAQAGRIPRVERVRALASALVVSYRAGDLPGVATAAQALSSRLAELAPAVYPNAKDLRMEVHYNALKPFRTAWLFYLLGFLALLASFPLASRGLTFAAYAALAVGFLLNSYGMLLRMLISGRPPVTNMYETIVFVAWGGMLFALVFETVYKTHVFGACAGALGALALILADNVPIFDAAIAPLVPVLRDNMWLTVHVLTIMLGYAAFTLAMGIGHLNLGLYFFRPAEAGLFKRLSLFLYRSLQVGTLFLAIGTLLGGVWASYSWGRFWGWDPKETWALIALLGYLAVLHGRFAGWIKDFGMAVGAIVCYLLVLMAWYGVNFVLGTGLHSYGFGSGGYWYVGSFVAFEVLVIAAAALRRRRFAGGHAPAATVAAPAAL